MTERTRPAPAAAADPPSAETPLDAAFAAIFEAADAGDDERVKALMKAAADQKAADAGDDGQTYTDDDDDDTQLSREERLRRRGPSAILIKAMSTASTKDRNTARKPYERLKAPIPLITRGDPAAHAAALRQGRPHLHGVIDRILTDLAPREVIRLRPTILVGPPGCGKTTLARAICNQLGLPVVVYPAAGVADGTFGGTSAHWSNTAPSVVVQHIMQSMVANVAIVVDEVEKATQGSHNGSLLDVLLGFMDRGNASVFRDPSLECVVDCSHVNWLLTANDLKSIPGPLRDRCRIVKVPDPEWRHIGEISRSILDSIADDRDLDRRWLHDLEPDEIKLIGRHWRGGSLRKLVRIIEVIVHGRDRHMARA